MKRIDIEPSWLDNLVSYINPRAGLERLHYKARLSLLTNKSYKGADKSRRGTKSWNPASGADADTDLSPDLVTLRDRSRDLIRNAPLATGAINTKVTNVVGTGLKLQSQIDYKFLGLTKDEAKEWQQNVEREFRNWAKYCDIERTLNFTDMQELVFRSVLENGDVFALLPYQQRPESPYGLKIQLVEADRVCNPGFAADTPNMVMGVEKDKWGAPTVYHILKFHPGSRIANVQDWAKVEAFGRKTGRRKVLHLYKKLRVGQTRGIPDLAPVIEALKQLDDYTEAEITAAVVSGLFTVFVKSEHQGGLAPMQPAGTGAPSNAKADDDYKMGPGAMLDLLPGEDVQFANPARPNQAFDPFVMAVLRQIGVALELPFEILIKHFTSSYSAARAAIIEAWKFFMARREWLANNFCQPVYETWLTEAVLLGRIHAPGFIGGDQAIREAYCKAHWIGPAKGQIDELKEAKAAEIWMDRGVKTLDDVCAEVTGTDWEDKHEQRVTEVIMRREAGLEDVTNRSTGEVSINENAE